MRRIVFATVHAGRWVHYLECAHLSESARAFGVRDITVQVWDQEGHLVFRETVPLEKTLWRLEPPCHPTETYLVTLESAFPTREVPFIYGYVQSQGASGSGAAVYYPLNIALGSRHSEVWDNVGHFVWGTPSSRHMLRLFVGNPSRWAVVEGLLTLTFAKRHPERRSVRLKPKQHRIVDLWPSSMVDGDEFPEALEFVSSSSLVTYVMGAERDTERVTFIDHLMDRHR